MAYDFEESFGQRITFSPNADYSSAIAISFWFKAESLPGAHQMHFIDKGINNAGNNRNFSNYWTPVSGGQFGLSWDNPAGSYHEWSITATLPTGVWTHWYAEIDWTASPDNPRLWLDAVSKTLTNTFGGNDSNPLTTATQQISIGGEHGSADNVNNYDGLLAEVAIWSDNNSSERLAALAAGYSPAFFQKNLVEYIPLVRELINVKGGTGTLSASAPIVADHPRIIYPKNHLIFPFASGVVSQFRPKSYLSMMGIGN